MLDFVGMSIGRRKLAVVEADDEGHSWLLLPAGPLKRLHFAARISAACIMDVRTPHEHRITMSPSDRDVEKNYTNAEFVEKLRRLADSIEAGENFEIQVAGERIYVPDRAVFSVEHEREDGVEELEFQVRWELD